MKFKKETHKVFNLGRNSPRNQYILRLMQLESNFTEKDLVGNKLNINQQWALVTKQANGILCCVRQVLPAGWGGDPSSLLSTGEAAPEVLCPVLSFSAKERHKATGASPTTGH